MNLLPGALAVFAIQGPEHGVAVLDDERQLEQLQWRRRPGKAHGGHVAERQFPALDHRHEIPGRATELEDTADQLKADAVAELSLEQLAESRCGAIVDRRRLLVPTELDDQFHSLASAGGAPAPRRPAARTSLFSNALSVMSCVCYIPKREGGRCAHLHTALGRPGYAGF